MELKSETMQVIWCGDLENFISSIYGREADIQQTEEASQNSFAEVNLTYEADYDVMERITKWLNDDPSSACGLYAIDALTMLAMHGHIEGNKKYLVTMWW